MLQFVLIIKNMRKCIKKSFDEVENNDEVMENIGDKFENIHMISSSIDGIEKEMKFCVEKSDEILEQRLESNDCIINTHIDGYISNSIVFCIILLYTHNLYKQNEINMEDITTILLTMNTFFNNMYEITYYIPEITKKIGILNSHQKFIGELFGHTPNVGNDIDIIDGTITFNNVFYTYDSSNSLDLDNDEPNSEIETKHKSIVINNLSTSIKKNTMVAIYGPSGSGKTTFVKLILNILKPQKGTISIDNQDVKLISNKSLKKYISYVSQNKVSLFDVSILDNLTYGYYDKEEILEMIKSLIKKYDLSKIFVNINRDMELKTGIKDEFGFLNYNVGKHGNMLSGGQRQIIHIIRAVLNKFSKIIILDEPTTALDNLNRDNVIRMIKDNCKTKTVLIITHDEQIKKICDSVIKFG